MKHKKVELLAPAGNKEAFFGAVHAGADAVYLGGDKFGARAYADNFTTDELISCIRYAHIHGRKVYLTVNTLVKDREWDQLYDYIRPFYEAGLDGVIIQDLGVFLYLKKQFPGIELHVSTQMTLTGVNGAAYMKELGACRIVPARELSLEEIRHIKQETGLEIEAFIHGAMCYCYSGQCLFSSILGGRSGNRGRCAQPCRLPYTVEGAGLKGQYYPLSLKDMCTIEHLPELIEAGIDSFKIEGRMKKPEYAAGVTAIYRKAIDRYYADPGHFHISQKELQKLSGLYIRSERQEGYYHKHNGADMVTLQNPAYSGSDEPLLAQIRSQYLEQKLRYPLSMSACFAAGQPAELTISMEHPVTGAYLTVTAYGDTVSAAQNKPVSEENVAKQLKKLGETSFSIEDLQLYVEEGIFYPLKAINDLRRNAVELLESKLISSYGLTEKRSCQTQPAEAPEKQPVQAAPIASSTGLRISISTPEQLEALLAFYTPGQKEAVDFSLPDIIYLSADLVTGEKGALHREQLQHWKAAMRKASCNVRLNVVLPYILRKRDEAYLKSVLSLFAEGDNLFEGCMVRSLEGYAFLKKMHFTGPISADAGFYVWNQETLSYWNEHLASFTLPYELNAGEQRTLLRECRTNAEKVIYGHLPMMISANCVLKTTGQCHQKNQTILTDRYQKRFPVVACCDHCMNIIYNSVPLSLHATADRWKKAAGLRLDFTIEKPAAMIQILKYFINTLNGETSAPPYQDYTTGHEKRGVE